MPSNHCDKSELRLPTSQVKRFTEPTELSRERGALPTKYSENPVRSPRPAGKHQTLVTNPRSLHVRGSPERREGGSINQHGSAQHFPVFHTEYVLTWPLGARAILQGLASASVRVVVRCPADNPTAAPVLNQVLCAPAEVWRAASGLAPVERDMPLPCCPRSRLGPSEAGDARQRQLYVCDGVVGIA